AIVAVGVGEGVRRTLGVAWTDPESRLGLKVSMSGRLLMLTLIGVLVCVRTLAYADTPDPTWIEGFWEDDDYDDVVLYATSFRATETAPLCALRPHWTQVWIVPLDDEPLVPSPAIPPHPPRGPPLA